MKTPKRIQPLIEDGLVDEVLSRLMSGKEADVYVVRCGNQIRCAKVYKEAENRGFKQVALYQEGRRVKNSRRARAMEKGSKFGRKQQEETWQTAEVDALYRMAKAGVRVPRPYGCVDGILLMELITDSEGLVAPRLCDVVLTPEQAIVDHAEIMHDVLRMLCAGLIHGDLSEFNVLVDKNGPVIIDFPQAIDAAANNSAQAMLTRDVENMTNYYGQFAPALLNTKYPKEIWSLYEDGKLHADVALSGRFEERSEAPDVDGLLLEIEAVAAEALERQERMRDAEQLD